MYGRGKVLDKSKDGRIKHGNTRHPLYAVWCNMKNRCYNKKVKQYENYGGRGVIVCVEWVDDFNSFFQWAVSNGWEKGLELDKDIKGDGLSYSPSTCCFVTSKINSNNRRSNKIIKHNGEEKTLSQWGDFFNVNPKSICIRMHNGFSFSEAVERAVNNIGRSRRLKCVTNGVEYVSTVDAGNKLGINSNSIARVARGERSSIKGYLFKYLN